MQNPQTLHTYQNKQRSERKHLRHKHTTSAKTRQGFDLSKHPNQNGHIKCKAKANRMPWKNQKMDARKGDGTFFFHKNLWHPSFDLPKTKKNKDPRGQQRERKGGDVFSPKIKFPRIASSANKSYIETSNTLAKIPPGNDSLGRGGDVFQEPP